MTFKLDADLMAAIRKDDLQRVESLLKEGASPDAFTANDTYGYYSNALILAARSNTPGMLEMLLSYKPKTLNAYDYDGMGALHYAVRNSNWSGIDALLRAGALIDGNGGSAQKPLPLHTAIEEDLKGSETQRTEFLLERGADPFLINGANQSAFHIAPPTMHDLLIHHAKRSAAAREARRIREINDNALRNPQPLKIKQLNKRKPT